MNTEELELRKVEIEHHKSLQTMQRREGALQMAMSMSEGIFGPKLVSGPADEFLKLESKEIFKLANQIIKFIEKES